MPISVRRASLRRYPENGIMNKPAEINPFEQARILSEALPYMQRYDQAIVVVKYGGHAMGNESVAREFARDIVMMVLAGSINKQIVGYVSAAGGRAIGLCGKDGNMVLARKVSRTVVDPDSNIE